jgi:hypothetical protein
MKVLMHKPNDSGNSSYLHIWILKYISISSGVVLVVPCLVLCLATQLVSTEYKIHSDYLLRYRLYLVGKIKTDKETSKNFLGVYAAFPIPTLTDLLTFPAHRLFVHRIHPVP